MPNSNIISGSLSNSESEECGHERADFNTFVCKICGVILDKVYVSGLAQVSDYEESRYVKGKCVRKAPLYPESLDLPYGKDVIERACQISDRLTTSGNRINKLKMRRFACLYFALRELGYKFIHYEVADAVGLKRTDISPAVTLFSSVNSGYRPPRNVIANGCTPPAITMAQAKVKSLEFDEESQVEVRIMIEKALAYPNQRLKRRRPETIATGAIYAYIEISGIKIAPGIEIGISKISGSTIKQTVSEILEAYNHS